LSGLPPGEYLLRLELGDLSAAITTTVAGEDIAGIQLTVARPSTLTGRIIVDPAARESLPATSTIRVGLTALHPEAAPVGSEFAPSGTVGGDLTFEIKSRPGAWRIEGSAGSGWAAKTIRANGVDVIDSGIDVRPNEDISGLEIELTNRLTDLSGIVTANRGETVRDYSVEVFAQDSARWSIPTYVRTLRPGRDGRFRTSGLRPGSYYAIALDYIDPGEANDPEFLERVRTRAVRFSLGEAETKTLDLTLIVN
jgi:hypothetical protein